MTITDPSLRPSDRYCLILSEQLSKDGFILKQKKFERLFEYGKQIIDFSFISTFGFIHGVEFYCHIIFDNAEKVFKKLFGTGQIGLCMTKWGIYSNIYMMKVPTLIPTKA